MLIFVGHSYQGYTAPHNYIPHYREVEDKYPLTFQFAYDALQGEHLLADIRNLIANSAACIFDFTGQSRNVMIEYGMAVALGKPHMLLVRMGQNEAVPAMIEGLRFKEYWFAETLKTILHDFVAEQIDHNAAVDANNIKRKCMAFVAQMGSASRQQIAAALAIDGRIVAGALQSLCEDGALSVPDGTRQYILSG